MRAIIYFEDWKEEQDFGVCSDLHNGGVLTSKKIIGSFDESYHKVELHNLKVCKGCGHRSDSPIKKTAFACCPDNNYIPLNDYLKNSIYHKLQTN